MGIVRKTITFILLFFVIISHDGSFSFANDFAKAKSIESKEIQKVRRLLPIIDRNLSELGYSSSLKHWYECFYVINHRLWTITVNPEISLEYIDTSSSTINKEITNHITTVYNEAKSGNFKAYYTTSELDKNHIYAFTLVFKSAKIGPYQIWHEGNSIEKESIIKIKSDINPDDNFSTTVTSIAEIEQVISQILKEVQSISDTDFNDEAPINLSILLKKIHYSISRYYRNSSPEFLSNETERMNYLQKISVRINQMMAESEKLESSWIHIKILKKRTKEKLSLLTEEAQEIYRAIHNPIGYRYPNINFSEFNILNFIKPTDIKTYGLLKKFNLHFYMPILENFYKKYPRGSIKFKFDTIKTIYPYIKTTESQIVRVRAKIFFNNEESNLHMEKEISYDLTINSSLPVEQFKNQFLWKESFIENYYSVLFDAFKEMDLLHYEDNDVSEISDSEEAEEDTVEEVAAETAQECKLALKSSSSK